MTVAPLTATVLADADQTDAGIASAINNAIARVAGLVGISVIGVVVASTLAGRHVRAEPGSVRAFHEAVAICALLVAVRRCRGRDSGSSTRGAAVQAERCSGGQLAGVPEPAVELD